MPSAALPSDPSIPIAPVTAAVLDALRAIVGDKGLILDEHDKQPFVTDWRGKRVGRAAAVVRPANTEEVSRVLKLCYDNGIAIVPHVADALSKGGLIATRPAALPKGAPAYFTASGTAILSALPKEERLDLPKRTPLEPLTPHTMTDPDKLLERVRVAATRGYSVQVNESVMGDISVAAPVIDEHGRAVAAVNISVPTTRWTRERAEAELVQHVHVAATSISKSKANRYAA